MTIFKKIINKEIPAEIVYEDEQCLAFRDVNPQAPVHILVIPKKEIPSVLHLMAEDEPLMGHIMTVIKLIAEQLELAEGFRVVINNGYAAGQTVAHLHFHILAGRRLNWPPG